MSHKKSSQDQKLANDNNFCPKADIQGLLPTSELTKFCKDWAKGVDFYLKPNFGHGKSFMRHPLSDLS